MPCRYGIIAILAAIGKLYMEMHAQHKGSINKEVWNQFLRDVDGLLDSYENMYITGGAALAYYSMRDTFSDVDVLESVSPKLKTVMDQVHPDISDLCNADAATLAWDYDCVEWQNGVSEQLGLKNIQVKVPPLEFLLVSKCCSMRFDPLNENQDSKDIWKIVKKLNIQSIDEVEAYANQYHLHERFSKRSKAITRDIIEAIQKNESYNPYIAM